MSTLTHLGFTNNGLVTALICYKEKCSIANCSKIHLDVYYVFKRVSFGSKECTKDLKVECDIFWA